ncbi:ABC transporter, permease protein (cluster 3, basic aa/glutamine/opines) [hydrothermal vent metagenome]|uniref:ABC transporter, permease protein (Cluster 3, basic aa/glutamine/opines) n=1 Tax=hydrothermal vent metagenome TaxID=652676 RepID=A0A3B0UJX6_9ZZZZ
MTLFLAITAVILGFVLALVLGMVYQSRYKPVRLLAHGYVQFFRGIPLILLLLLVHQVLGSGRQFGLNRTVLTSALVALTLYSSAYQAEIVRAGLQATPPNMIESARLLGSSKRQAYWLIQIRYSWHIMLPAFTGQAISLFKDTSVVLILGVAELMTVARIALGSDLSNAPYWLPLSFVVGFLYFIVAFTLSRVAQRWEKAHHTGDLVHSLANY